MNLPQAGTHVEHKRHTSTKAVDHLGFVGMRSGRVIITPNSDSQMYSIIQLIFEPSALSRPNKSYNCDLLDLGEHLGPKQFFELFSKQHATYFLGLYSPNLCFFQNGSPGQTTLLDRFDSKFCVEPRSENPNISHMSQNTIRKLPT